MKSLGFLESFALNTVKTYVNQNNTQRETARKIFPGLLVWFTSLVGWPQGNKSQSLGCASVIKNLVKNVDS